jgi:hypothetical protein
VVYGVEGVWKELTLNVSPSLSYPRAIFPDSGVLALRSTKCVRT